MHIDKAPGGHRLGDRRPEQLQGKGTIEPVDALHERGLYEWEEFRQALIAHIAEAERRPGPFAYYEIWLQTFEDLLARKGLVTPAELEETTYQFEFGERDDVF